jgi:metal-sulfur cluster biosynthetic enzyme
MLSQACVDTIEARLAEARAALDEVMDPELDAPVTEMGFIEDLALAGDNVNVVFRLPTFWCAANFAYLMGHDMKMALQGLPWTRRVRITLVDHFAARRINAGLAADWPFERIFAADASSDLNDLRRTFRDKAFLGRQIDLIQCLRRRMDVTALLDMRIAELETLAGNRADSACIAAQRYLAARRSADGPCDADARAFTTLDGEPIAAHSLISHLREARRIAGAARANAELCRMQLSARYQDMPKGAGTVLERQRYER